MIERTQDYRRARRLAGFPLTISSEVVYLIEREGGEDLGLWTLHKHKDGLMIHADMGLKCRGRKAIESLKMAFGWVFKEFGVNTIYAGIPQENKPSCQVAVKAGMNYTGLNNNLRFFEVNNHGFSR